MNTPSPKQREIAKEVIKNRAVRRWVTFYIKNGRGYSDPTDLFDDGPPDSLPKKFRRYFEGGGIYPNDAETPEEYQRLQALLDKDPLAEILCSRAGAIALMDAVLNKK